MVHFWLRKDALQHGLLPFPASSSLSPQAVVSLARTLRSADTASGGGAAAAAAAAAATASGSMPRLVYQHWADAALSTLQIDKQRAQLYFDLFNTVRDRQPEEAQQCARIELAADESERAQLRADASVDLYSFMVFLFLQCFNKPSLRSPRAFRSEMWPGNEPASPEAAALQNLHNHHAHLPPQVSAALTHKAGEEPALRDFVKNHLEDLVTVLATAGELTAPLVDRLGLMLAAGPTLNVEVARLSDAMPFWRSSGGSPSVHDVVDFITHRFGANELAHPPLPRLNAIPHSPGQPPSSPQLGSAVGGGGADAAPPSPAAVAAAIAAAGLDDVETRPVADCTTIVGVNKKTVVRADAQLNHGNVRIICCSNSFIYILGHVRFVTIFGCTNCTIVVGAAQNVIDVEHAERVTVIAACGHLRVSNSSASLFYLCTNQPAHLVGENRHLQFAPYNTHYPLLETHLTAAGINPSLQCNRWARPMVTGAVSKAAATDTFALLPVDKFMPFAVPFTMSGGKTVENPCELPPAYEKALAEKNAAIASIREMLKDTKMATQAERDFHTHVQKQFKEFLIASGHLRQIQDLLHLETAEHS